MKPFIGVTEMVSVPLFPEAMVSLPTLAARVKSDPMPAPVTVRATAEDVLAANVTSPPYIAVTEYEPAARLLVEKVAWPPEFSVPVPRDVAPFRKVTVPVGVPLAVGVTCAVNVILEPAVIDLAEAVSVVAVAAGPVTTGAEP